MRDTPNSDQDVEAACRTIEREFDAVIADANLEAARSMRLWSLAALAVIFGVVVATTDELTAGEAARLVAIIAGSSAAFHIVTWAILRMWLRRAHGR